MGFYDVVDAIVKERDDQDQQWGGPAHDDSHSWGTWQVLILKHAARLEIRESRAVDYRERLIKIAALAVAAVEAYDRE